MGDMMFIGRSSESGKGMTRTALSLGPPGFALSGGPLPLANPT
jgi:hypothetical protein